MAEEMAQAAAEEMAKATAKATAGASAKAATRGMAEVAAKVEYTLVGERIGDWYSILKARCRS
jgi:hypothetical protein